jgi:hypothetical protein
LIGAIRERKVPLLDLRCWFHKSLNFFDVAIRAHNAPARFNHWGAARGGLQLGDQNVPSGARDKRPLVGPLIISSLFIYTVLDICPWGRLNLCCKSLASSEKGL